MVHGGPVDLDQPNFTRELIADLPGGRSFCRIRLWGDDLLMTASEIITPYSIRGLERTAGNAGDPAMVKT